MAAWAHLAWGVGLNAQAQEAVPLARPVDAQGPSAVVRARAAVEAGLDSPRGAVALAAVANDSSSEPAAAVELREWLAPPWEAVLAAVRQAVQLWVQRAVRDSRTTQPSCTPVDARIASSRR